MELNYRQRVVYMHVEGGGDDDLCTTYYSAKPADRQSTMLIRTTCEKSTISIISRGSFAGVNRDVITRLMDRPGVVVRCLAGDR